MWFNIDYDRYGIEQLPIKWRDSISVAYLKALLLPIKQIYYRWFNLRNDNIYKLEHTGQVCSLRGSLNDLFDAELRRIYIGDGQQNSTTYVHTEAELQELHTNTEPENDNDTMYVFTESETSDTGLDFIVYVPGQIVDAQIFALKAHIDFYKADGKRYVIISI